MGFRHVLDLIIIAVIMFLANSNSPSFASDDFLFSGTETSSDDELLAFNSPDALGPLSSNMNNDDLFSSQSDSVNTDEPFELAGCSAFENLKDLPIISKSRSRRSGSSCSNPGAGAEPLKSESEFEFSGGGSLRTWGEEGIYDRRNGQCLLMTAGALSWGVCYKPTEPPLAPMGTSIVPYNSGRVVSSFFLTPCTLVSGDFTTCLVPGWDFYCCVFYEPRIQVEGPLPTDDTGDAVGCVSLSIVQQGNGPWDPE